jgi:hypothetical protein
MPDDSVPSRGIRNGLIGGVAIWAVFIGIGLLACDPAVAQNATANAGAISGSNSASGSDSRSGSISSIQQNFNTPAEQRVTYGGGTRSEVVQSGTVTSNINQNYSGTQTLRNVPNVYAPSFGGTNPCTVSASAGGSGAGIGITIGGSWSDPGCERRNLAVIAVQALNDPALAREILCGTTDYRQARQRIGQPCAMDVPPGGAPVQIAAAAAPVAIPPPAVIPAAVTFPAWCSTVGAGDPVQAQIDCGLSPSPRPRRR